MRLAALMIGRALSSLLPAQENSSRPRSCRECNYPIERPCNLAECKGFEAASRSPFDMHYPDQQPVQRRGTVSASELRHRLSKSGEKAILDARAKFAAGRTEAALADLKKAQDDSSTRPYALSLLGEFRLRSGDIEAAVPLCEPRLRYCPSPETTRISVTRYVFSIVVRRVARQWSTLSNWTRLRRNLDSCSAFCYWTRAERRPRRRCNWSGLKKRFLRHV